MNQAANYPAQQQGMSQQLSDYYVTKAQLDAGLAEARRTRTDQTFRETALATATATSADGNAETILANAERFLAFLEGRREIGEAKGEA